MEDKEWKKVIPNRIELVQKLKTGWKREEERMEERRKKEKENGRKKM